MKQLQSGGSSFELRALSEQQSSFFDAQLRAVGNLALGGAGPDLGIGLDVKQHFLFDKDTTRQDISSLLWRDPSNPLKTHFAALPLHSLRHKYFGTATIQPDDRIHVEGVDIHNTGSYYQQLVLSDSDLAENNTNLIVPQIASAFIGIFDTRNATLAQQRNVMPDAYSLPQMTQDTHRRLGKAILSFWNTTRITSVDSIEPFRNHGAYGLAELLLGFQFDQIKQGGSGGFKKLSPYVDTRDNMIGFFGTDSERQTTTVMLRDPTLYPNTIDFIEIPFLENNEAVLVRHYAFTKSDVALRACVLSQNDTKEDSINDLVAKIRSNRSPLRRLDPSSTETVLKELYEEFGFRLQSAQNR